MLSTDVEVLGESDVLPDSNVLLSCNSLSFTKASMYASLSSAVATLASDM